MPVDRRTCALKRGLSRGEQGEEVCGLFRRTCLPDGLVLEGVGNKLSHDPAHALHYHNPARCWDYARGY